MRLRLIAAHTSGTAVALRGHWMASAGEVLGQCGPLNSPRNCGPRTQCGPRNWTTAHTFRARPRTWRPRTHNAARALCAGPRTLRGSAHCAWARAFCVGSRPLQPARLAAHALISFSMQFSTHSSCYPSKSRPMLSKANTIFLTQGRNQSLHNLLIMPQLCQSSNRTDGFLTSWHFKTLRNIEIFTKLLQTWNIYQESRVVVTACLYLKRDICSVWYDSDSCNTIVVLDAAFDARKFAP